MFVTLEGGEGSGKTTQFRLLGEWLAQHGHAPLLVREPGGTALGEAVREILLHHKAGTLMHANTELLLFCASRAQLVAERIKPHLAQGGVVLCDRFADTTLAYQGYGRGLDLNVLRSILAFATQGLQPDLTLYFDIDPVIGLARRASDGGLNRLDAESAEFHRRARQGYAALAAAEPQRWRVIDANQPISAVFAQASQQIATQIG
jgi:dTMP kinase